MKDELIVVAGAGGFIGGHLVADLSQQGRRIRAVDIKPVKDWWQIQPAADNRQLDLSQVAACYAALAGATQVV